MRPDRTRPRGVHLVGSVPLADAESVFRLASATLGERLVRLPDGETGARANWIAWQLPVLGAQPCFEVLPPDASEYAPNPRVRVRPDLAGERLAFGALGYAAAARSSWPVFERLQTTSVIPARCRFQVSLPTPLAPVNALVVPADQARVEPLYEVRLLDELDEIAVSIPHER